METNEDFIIEKAYPVKYHSVEYYDRYVVVTQNRIRRRVYNGYFFDDNGEYIYISEICVGMFQHKKKPKIYSVNTETKTWEEYVTVTAVKHRPEKMNPVERNEITILKSE